MLSIAIGLALIATQPNDLAEEGLWLGRASTLFGVCGGWYAVDPETGRRAADDFAERAKAAGWESDQISDAYDAGRAIEREDLGMQVLPSGKLRIDPEQPALFYQRARTRCEVLGTMMPGAISNMSEGHRNLDRLIQSGQGRTSTSAGDNGPQSQSVHPQRLQQFRGYRSGFVQGSLNVAPSEKAILRLRADGNHDLIDVESIDLDYVVPPQSGSRGPINNAREGTITFALHGAASLGMLLKIENNTSQGFAYKGFIVPITQGRAQPIQPTTVCTIPPGKVVYEHWPYPLVQFVAGGFAVNDDAVSTCEAEPEAPAALPAAKSSH